MEQPPATLAAIFVLIFFVFSCAGWLMEVFLKYLQYHRFINRGFFIGPYCPIYGWGALLITVLVGGLLGREGTIGETFFAGMVVCGALEYFTSWYMEKLFHARWWDYSGKPMNLHGRIWIGNLLLFGLASVLILKLIVPRLLHWFSAWPAALIKLAALGILLLMTADAVLSHILMGLVKKEIDTQQGDSTEEISRQMHALLKNRGILLRRIQAAYPNAQARSKRLTQELQSARKAFRQADRAFRTEAKRAAKAALGKLEGVSQGAQADWKARLELAEEKRRSLKKKLREVERRFFPPED